MHSLRWYISVGFLMVGVVPLIFFGAQRISSLFATQTASIQQKHEPMAESLAQAIYGYLLDQTSALQSTASQLESDNASLARLNEPGFDPTHLNQELAAAHSAQPALLQLYVGSLNGRAVAAAPTAAVGADYSVWNYVREVLNPRRTGPTYSDVVRSQGDTSVAAVVIAVPILNAQRNLIGFLAGTVNLSEVQRLSNYSRIGVNGQAVVVDRRGRVIAHPRNDWRIEAKDLSSQAIFQQSLGQENGVSWYTDLDGNEPRAAGFATVPVVGWKVWISQPVADLRTELTPLILSTLEWLLVAIVLALVLGFIAAAWITRPVVELTRAAGRIAQGDFVTPVVVRERFAAKEMRELAHTFNQMARQLISAVLDSISPLAQEKGLRIDTRFPPGLPAVEGDAARLKQILINLLSNAVKFTDRGHIEVIAQPSGRMVRIAVKDTGIGISREAQKLIFDEFVQGDGSSTRRHGGTGLGLSIVRKLVEMHGGAITVISEPGMGSTFTFTVPAWATGQGTATPLQPRPLRRPNQGLPGTAILVVDDDPSVRQLISRHLEQEGWKTVQASNATDALQLARESRPMLITLDIMMPDASGWWVLEKLKEDPQTAGIPVLVVTIVEDQRLVFALGASDYLGKPYDRGA